MENGLLKNTLLAAAIGFSLILSAAMGQAQETKSAPEDEKSVDNIAKELSNPIGSLASLNASFLYQTFKGDLPDADDQDSWQFQFQPVFPFPQANGNNLIIRPLVPVYLDQPYFDLAKPGFDDKDIELGDISGDIAYGRSDNKKGLFYFGGLFFSTPSGSDGDLGSDQWRLGPEAAYGIIRKWGLIGALAFHQWDVAGSNDTHTSITSAQYFYAFGLGNGWQITSSPILIYDWRADSGSKWTVPIGAGISKTTKIGDQPWKFKLEAQYYVAQADAFGPEWLLKLTITPVIQNPFLKWFR